MDTVPEDAAGRDVGSVQEFAADLRRARLDAGNPTLARLQSETGISRTVISEAFAGRQLPTVRTVDGLIRYFGSDPAGWLDRRDAIASDASRSEADNVPMAAHEATMRDETPSASSEAGRRAHRGILAGATVAAFLVGALISAVIASLFVSQSYAGRLAEAEQAAAAGPKPAIAVETGEDPAFTECIDDASVLTADSRVNNTLLEIIWSDQCYAGWGRITRYDAKMNGNALTIAIYPRTSPDGSSRQEATVHDAQSAYTFLVVRPTADTLLCAEGSFTVDGETFDLGEPLCS